MIIIFGPPGAGKSVQGQMLAARMGWRWLSTGQLLRDTRDQDIAKYLQVGQLVPHQVVTRVMSEAIHKSTDIKRIILDGFPREVEQAKWLVDSQPDHGRSINLLIVLDVSRDEISKRLSIRGRNDDQPEVIDARVSEYFSETQPVIDFFDARGADVVHIDGEGSVGEVHDRIVAELEKRDLV